MTTQDKINGACHRLGVGRAIPDGALSEEENLSATAKPKSP